MTEGEDPDPTPVRLSSVRHSVQGSVRGLSAHIMPRSHGVARLAVAALFVLRLSVSLRSPHCPRGTRSHRGACHLGATKLLRWETRHPWSDQAESRWAGSIRPRGPSPAARRNRRGKVLREPQGWFPRRGPRPAPRGGPRAGDGAPECLHRVAADPGDAGPAPLPALASLGSHCPSPSFSFGTGGRAGPRAVGPPASPPEETALS